MRFPFQFPATIPNTANPIWVGNGFQIGDRHLSVLEYSNNNLGWNDELTSFHEETAGDNHCIDRCSRLHALQQINQFVKAKSPTLLEIGCSSGFMLELIARERPDALLIGSDVVYQPLIHLAKRLPSVPLLRFDLTTCPLPDNAVDAVILLNVLEHIEHDILALQQVMRILKPGGIAIIEVPAGPHLYDIYDQYLKHYRRYALSNLVATLKQLDLSILKQSHLGCFVYPAFSLVKRINKKKFNLPAEQQKTIVEKNITHTSDNWLMKLIMSTELMLGKVVRYPVGIRCLVTCQKPL